MPIRCLTLEEGPPGIESQVQADLTIAPMLRFVTAQSDASGFVIAASEIGLHALRDQTALRLWVFRKPPSRRFLGQRSV